MNSRLSLNISLLFLLGISSFDLAQTTKGNSWIKKNQIESISLFEGRNVRTYFFDLNGYLHETNLLDTAYNIMLVKELYQNGLMIYTLTKEHNRGEIIDSTVCLLSYNKHDLLLKRSVHYCRPPNYGIHGPLECNDSSIIIYSYHGWGNKVEEFGSYPYERDQFHTVTYLHKTVSGLDSLEILVDFLPKIDTVSVKRFVFEGTSLTSSIEYYDNHYYHNSYKPFWVYIDYEYWNSNDLKFRSERRFFGTNDKDGLLEHIEIKFRRDGSAKSRIVKDKTGKVIEAVAYLKSRTRSPKNYYESLIDHAEKQGLLINIEYYQQTH